MGLGKSTRILSTAGTSPEGITDVSGSAALSHPGQRFYLGLTKRGCSDNTWIWASVEGHSSHPTPTPAVLAFLNSNSSQHHLHPYLLLGGVEEWPSNGAEKHLFVCCSGRKLESAETFQDEISLRWPLPPDYFESWLQLQSPQLDSSHLQPKGPVGPGLLLEVKAVSI